MKTPPLIPWPLLLLTALAIMAALMVTAGCASVPQDLQSHEEKHCEGWSHTGSAPFYTWERKREAAPKPWLYVRAIDPDSACRALGATEAGAMAACAQWHPSHCIIVLPEDSHGTR